jgi:hypothetical protein
VLLALQDALARTLVEEEGTQRSETGLKALTQCGQEVLRL